MPDICSTCEQPILPGESSDTFQGDTYHECPDDCVAARDRMWQTKLAEIEAAHARRVTELQEACNAELAKKRRFEAEANQEYAERMLVRAECIRQRDRAERLAEFIESLPLESVPVDVRAAMRATFLIAADADAARLMEEAFDLGYSDAIDTVASGCSGDGFSVERVMKSAAEADCG